MEVFHRQLMSFISEVAEGDPARYEHLDVEELISDITPEIVERLRKSLQKSADEMLL